MAKRRTISDMRMGYDMYERHQAVGTLLGANLEGSVLDVGGLAGGLGVARHRRERQREREQEDTGKGGEGPHAGTEGTTALATGHLPPERLTKPPTRLSYQRWATGRSRR